MLTAPKAPVLFVSHGAPMFALEPGTLGAQLGKVGRSLANVKTVLVVSAHWFTPGGVKVTTSQHPETIHDFSGFPASLYRLQYPAKGQPSMAQDAARRLAQAGFPVEQDAHRGLDHGAWVPLYHLFPEADIPVFQVSMPATLTPAEGVALGKALSPLRDQGVLILASGSMTHNLREFRQQADGAEPYVREFAEWIRARVAGNLVEDLLAYRTHAPSAERAHPTPDHFLPLFVAMGARDDADTLQVLDDSVTYGVLSMESYMWAHSS
ncbi:DODA-type extradiol aromatic ring-opening family dioxygenase [Allopusillimonas ginsengisoli]|uniref:DODA-type extradiol aromatic ring-opening family dioxygenase n=1 Tax=Allopusillimonas ginsengisoli TaxID=453575 RepID=UPI00101F6A80|nr:class III extradiol ring-cleavage dioxygenase [Allopusillimonas ginsengisoli]TEA77518.1 dioxygenase [Allopusillimonas ginsengisoli]